ncbi:NlpC/P60 family protein [Actinocatenispora sera]|uniref:C40 family peptidase n=1 Tax=Actinocatenispora sera TaxID=390989 RepID=UPI0033E21763
MNVVATTRQLARAAMVLAAAAVVVLVHTPTAVADPQATEQQIDKTFNQLEKVGEEYKKNAIELRDSERRASKLGQQLKPLERKVDTMYEAVGRMSASVYEGGDLAAINSMMTSGSPSSLLNQVSTLDLLARRQHHQVAAYEKARNELGGKKKRLERIVTADRRKAKDLGAQKKKIQGQMDRLQQQHAKEVSDDTGGYVPPYVPGRAGKAVSFAYQQIGKPYVWDAAGPDSYDCSGLTMAAWATVGVPMEHYTGSQFAAFPKVPRDQLQPGDLVFWNNLAHEGMYIGDGRVIHAPQPGENVKISTMTQLDYIGPYDGAVRPS